jgi:hypothetical protein
MDALRQQIVALLVLATVLSPGAYAMPHARPIDVAGRKQLLVDRLFFDREQGIALRVERPRKTGEISLRREKPWESATLNWFSVLRDGPRVRMWYECYDVEGWPTADDTSFCYAESTDGVRWTKPDLGLFAYHGDPRTNILFRQIGSGSGRSRVHGAGVFLDPHAPVAERYKAVSQGIYGDRTPPYRIAGMTSPDGLHWTRCPAPICEVFGDSQYSGLWDAGLRCYVLFGRVGGHGRALGRSESDVFAHFPPLQLVLQTDAQDPPASDLYTPATIRYPYADGVYLAFPSLYEHRGHTLDIRLAVSRDGVHWTWPERVPYIPLGVPGSFDTGSLYMGQGIVRRGDELSLYYSGARINHQQAELEILVKPEGERIFSRVVTRLDRFVSASAGPSGGWFVTPPLRFRGARLELNLRTQPGGYARAALINAAGRAIPGFTLAECVPLRGDRIAVTAHWRGEANVATLAGQPVRLKVALRDAALYAFQFRR